jgi:hypothetical protein
VIARPRSRIVATEVEPAAKAAFAHYFIMIAFTSSKMDSPTNPGREDDLLARIGLYAKFSHMKFLQRGGSAAALERLPWGRLTTPEPPVLLRPEYCWRIYDTDRSAATSAS